MKAITLTAPYGTLIALGQKKIETRSWSTSYRGPLAIHQAKGLGPVGGMRGLWELCESEPFHSIIHPHCLPTALPRGAIVAVCELVDCLPIKIYSIGDSAENGTSYPLPPEPERSFGDYTPGRFAWLLGDVRALPEPIPAKGALSLWAWEGELSL